MSYHTTEVSCPRHECDGELEQVEFGAWFCPAEEEIIPDSEVGF